MPDLSAVLDGNEFLLFDGAMGTQLQERGLAAGELPELLCLTNPAEVAEVHAAYVAAGADVVTTNTFGANADKLGDAVSVEEVFSAAVACAKGCRYCCRPIIRQSETYTAVLAVFTCDRGKISGFCCGNDIRQVVVFWILDHCIHSFNG